MNFIKIFALALLFTFFSHGCKDKEVTPEGHRKIAGNYETRDIRIDLPEGSDFSLEGARLLSLEIINPVEGSEVEAAYNDELINPAYLFDKNNNLIMAGFITDSTTTVSVGSTAEFLLYYGLGTAFLPYEVTEEFVDKIGEVAGVKEWKKELEALFRADPLMLTNGAFAEPLAEKVNQILSIQEESDNGRIKKTSEKKSTSEKPADILVDANDIRSGLQLAENGLSKFNITNTLRRRAHAFVYKTQSTDLNDVKHELIPVIEGDIKAFKDIEISPTGGVTGFVGAVSDALAGKGLEFAATTTGDVEMPLNDNEKAAIYTIRVVGPGQDNLTQVTQDELSKLRRLKFETFALDFFLPLVSDIIGAKGMISKTKVDKKSLEPFIDKLATYVGRVPGLMALIEKGQYLDAATEFGLALYSDIMSGAMEDLVKVLSYCLEQSVIKTYHVPGADQLFDQVERKMKILQTMDLIMKGVDYSRLLHDISTSKQMESWTATASEIKITLSPDEFEITPLEQQKITAHLKTTIGDHQVVEYEWKTAGKYGYLWDERGHKGNEFSTTVKDVFYLCNAYASDLGDEEHHEEITLNIYLRQGQKRSKIGSGKVIATIKKEKDKKVFTVAVEPEVKITEVEGAGGTTYFVGSATYKVQFAEVEGAKSYTFRTILKDGRKSSSYSKEVNIENGIVKFTMGVGPVRLFSTYDKAKAEEERQNRLDYLEEVGYQGIEVTAHLTE